MVILPFPATHGNGNGNGNGNGSQGDAPGNSASAPGQVKKDDAATPVVTTTTPTPPPATTATADTTGAKPSSETAHETHAEAQSDRTKQYGNGHTAGQIAEQNGAPPGDVLHGPGNSQPHKLAPCSGGHEVDVHALKSHRHRGGCGGPEPSPTPAPHPHPQPDPGPPVPPPPLASTTTSTQQQTPPKDPGSKPAGGDASAAVATSAAHQGRSHSKSVLVSARHVATLPFTGARLWILVLAGLIMIATGLALREIRTAEASVESGHDHTDRTRHAARGSGAPLGGGPGR